MGKQPKLLLIAGPNGAGKSTLYESVIKPRKPNAEFINADVIERQKKEAGESIDSYQAARLAAERRDTLIEQKKDFVTETVFSHKSKNELVTQARDAGYQVVIYHVNVRSDNISVKRVAERVGKGGHDVPENKIRERYDRNQPLIREAVKDADRAFVYDNSLAGQKPRLTIELKQGKAVKVDRVPAWARDLYKEELVAFSKSKQNAAAWSFEEAKKRTATLISPSAKTRIAERGESYNGPIIAETSLHTVQQTSSNQSTAHFTGQLKDRPTVGDNVEINYSKSRAQQATVKTAEQGRQGPDIER